MNQYDAHTVQDLVGLCIRKDILVPPEALDDRRKLISLLNEGKKKAGTVTVVKNYTKDPCKRNVQDFVRYFNQRYRALSGILQTRKELETVVSIGRLQGKNERETVAIIGMVLEKRETKGKHIVLKLEDPTGNIDVWLHSKNKDLRELGNEIVLDEVIGITGQISNGRIFANSIIFPDVPLHKETRRTKETKYVIFVGDVEVGAKLFLKDEFENFIAWLSGNLGTKEQREIAEKVGYVVFVGDLVHGAGIYPNQEKDQNIQDIREQYVAFAKYIQMIPPHIQVVVTTGNHDAGRLQEPQLPLYRDLAKELYEMPNVTVLSNPCYFTIDKTEDFPGFDILLYHGYSLVYYADSIQRIREAGGQKVTDEIMKIFLKKRHLAPTHGSNTYVPDAEEDPMVIDKIPDFLVTGHIHRVSYGTYNGVTVLNAGCWNDASDEQVKRGLEPQPAKLPIVNLKTRKLHIMNFYKQKEAQDA